MPPKKTRNLRRTIALRWKRSPLALFLAAIFFSGIWGMLMLVAPWRIMQMGGTKSQVGAGAGVFFATYIVSCRLIGRHQDRLGVKRMAMLATSLSVVLLATMMSIDTTGKMIAMMGVFGVLPSMFWPSLMSWLSAGRDGASLNRRMGFFNMHWSMGVIAGPLLGGYLLALGGDRGHVIVFAVCSFMAACAFVLVTSARRLHTHEPPHKRQSRPVAAKLPSFLLASRISLIVIQLAFVSISGIIALLLKEMSLGPGFNGLIKAGQFLMMIGAFFLLGRTKRWHFNRYFLIVAQVIFAAIILAVYRCESGWLLATLTILAAIPVAICYSSSQYYGLSSNAPRAESMAIHEMLIGCGIAAGSFGGGYLAEKLGVRAMYPVMAGAAMLSAAAQLYILLRNKGNSDVLKNASNSQAQD